MILVDSETESNHNDSFEDIGIKYEPCEWIVNVVEVIELEIGLKRHETHNDENNLILLKADPNNESRYFAYHNAGLHAISIEFLPLLQRFFDDEQGTMDKSIC